MTLPLFNTLNLPFVVVKAEVFLDSGKDPTAPTFSKTASCWWTREPD